jgi:RsiW-degrading membrane proteinase PrsW (M82 family)
MLIFVSSVHKLAFNQAEAKELEGSYSRLFTLLKGASYPLPLAPAVVAEYSSAIIYLAGLTGLVGSYLVLTGRKLGSCILISWLLLALILHGPLTALPDQIEVQTAVLIMHWGVIAGLVLAAHAGHPKEKQD